MDELLAERNGQLLELGRLPLVPEAGDAHEEVQDLRGVASGLDPDGVAAARDTRHHRLGDTGRKSGRDGRVGRRPALGEDLEAGLGRRRMACSNAWRYLHLC